MVYKTKSQEDLIAEWQSIITDIENQYCIEELKTDSNNTRAFRRNNESDKIDERMTINSKIYNKYCNNKAKMKKMTSPTSVATNINLTQAVDMTPANTARAENNGNLTPAINTTCLPTTLTHDTEVITPHQTDDNYSPLLRRQINFDIYREISNVVNDAMICLQCNE